VQKYRLLTLTKNKQDTVLAPPFERVTQVPLTNSGFLRDFFLGPLAVTEVEGIDLLLAIAHDFSNSVGRKSNSPDHLDSAPQQIVCIHE